MAKRFTDPEKWKKPFIRSLQGPYKLLWMYICDDCDNAGIWQVDIEVACLRIGEKIDLKTAKEAFGSKIQEIDGGEKWFIPSFIEFQYPAGLAENNKAHIGVLKSLKKYNLIDDDLKIKPLDKALPRPLQGPKDMDMDKEMDKEQEQEQDQDRVGGVGEGMRTSPKKNRKPKPEPVQIQNPFSQEFLDGPWHSWKKFKAARRSPIIPESENAALRKLHRLSDGDEVTAGLIIEESIAQGWEGLYELKTGNGHPPPPGYKPENPAWGTVITSILTQFNEFAGTAYDPNLPEIRAQVASRLDKGAQESEMVEIVQLKAREWAKDPEMRKFLRPSTLFGEKYESYREEVRGVKSGIIKPINKNESNYERIQRMVNQGLGYDPTVSAAK